MSIQLWFFPKRGGEGSHYWNQGYQPIAISEIWKKYSQIERINAEIVLTVINVQKNKDGRMVRDNEGMETERREWKLS